MAPRALAHRRQARTRREQALADALGEAARQLLGEGRVGATRERTRRVAARRLDPEAAPRTGALPIQRIASSAQVYRCCAGQKPTLATGFDRRRRR
jgi:hypothetical protein